jgi:hypothetical protein
MNIKRRNIELDTVCPVCRRFDEDGAHCFLKCKLARHCWNAAQLGGVRCLLLNSHSSDEFIRMILELQADQCLRSVILLWKLWDTRNKANAGEAIPTCTEVVCAAHSVFRDFAGEVVQPNRANVQIYSWKPPVLLNFDGAFRRDRETQEAACGFIIRNHQGEPVLAGAENISPAMDALAVWPRKRLHVYLLWNPQRHGILGSSWKPTQVRCVRPLLHIQGT